VTDQVPRAIGGISEIPGGQNWHYRCPVPGQTAQFVFMPSINSSGFSLSNTDSGFPTIQTGSFNSAEVPSFLFPSSAAPAISPLTSSGGFLQVSGFSTSPFGTGNLFIKSNFDEGDAGLVSYRTTGN
jgi:hypothetical protein